MRMGPLESLLNRNIAASSVARALCERLTGKVLVLEAQGLPFNIYFQSHGNTMELGTQFSGAPHASLKGTPLSLLRLVGPQPESALRAGTVRIEGDAEVAQAFSEFLKHARPDLEEELSRVIGDVAAHQVGNLARSVSGFARRAGETFLQNVSEYLQEEGRDVPSRTEAEEFSAGVDHLREAVDRLEARVAMLERKSPLDR